jgi:hypothetical protein
LTFVPRAKPISQREAAKSHIDCAIRLLNTDDLEAHTLAYAAYGLLFELLGKGPTKDAVRKLEKKLKLGEIPNYFKHRYSNPSAIRLAMCSPAILLAFAHAPGTTTKAAHYSRY